MKGYKMITKKLLIGSAFLALLLIGCGGNSTDTTTTGYLVDAAVANVDYDCIADGKLNQTTGSDGAFSCTNMTQVRFRIGNLVLGEMRALPSDNYLFPQDLIGVARDSGVDDNRVIAMAQLLQSLDSDGNPTNGIVIAQEIKTLLVETERAFNPDEVALYLESTSINPSHIRTREQAREHLFETLQTVIGQSTPTPSTPVEPSTSNTPTTQTTPNIPSM
jgi:hypothetical protein